MTRPFAPPLDPPNDEAHRWLADELSKAKYSTGFDPLGWLLDRLEELFRTQPGGMGLPGWGIPLITAIVLIAVAIVVLQVGSRGRRRRTAQSGAFIDDPTLTAADYRRLAAQAEAAGDWDDLLVQSFRALAVSATERTLLDDRPGRTAHEVVVELVPVFPTYGDRLATAADGFDLVRYGDRSTTREAALAVRQLDDEVALARPIFAEAELTV